MARDGRRPTTPTLWDSVLRLIRTRISAGLITVLPILVTIWVVQVVFSWMRDASSGVVFWILRTDWDVYLPASWGIAWDPLPDEKINTPGFRWGIAITSVFLTIFFLYLVGLLTANVLGRRLLYAVELLVDRVPMVKTVYRGIKQILSSFGNEKAQFQRVGHAPFPHPGTRAVGFITNGFTDPATGREYVTMFIPTTPNPTTGFFQVFAKEDVIELPWTVEEAIRSVMSAGILLPDPPPLPPAQPPAGSRAGG